MALLTSACNFNGFQSGFTQNRLDWVLSALSSSQRKFPQKGFRVCCSSSALSSDPLLVKAARGDPVSRPPAWMMRQAGRYMVVYRKLAEKHPSFRERSETTDLIVKISLAALGSFPSRRHYFLRHTYAFTCIRCPF